MFTKLKIMFLSLFIFAMATAAYADGSIATPRIINGTQATEGEFPFQVELMRDHGSSYSVYCGGTLISSTWVVTAAHCITEVGNPTHIIYGTNTISPLDDGQTVAVSNVYVHENYAGETQVDGKYYMDNDIALLQLASPVNVAPMDYLSMTGNLGYVVGTLATVSGWGTTESGSGSNVLMKTNLRVFNHERCADIYNGTTNPISNNMICAGYTNGATDSCTGDSGGPLFVQNTDGTETLIGIVSYGVGCAENGYPGVYTNISQYINWLESKTGLTLTGVAMGSEPPSPYGVDDISSDYDLDTTERAEESGTIDNDTVAVYVYGGDTVEDYGITTSAHFVSTTQDTLHKLTFKLTPSGDGEDAAVIIDFTGSGDKVSDFNFYMCDVVTSICSEFKTKNTSENWVRILVENNGDYDYNRSGIGLRAAVSSRDIVDKVDADIYVTENNTAGDIVDSISGGGGGGGCSATGEGSAFSFFALLSVCGLYFFRRKLSIVRK